MLEELEGEVRGHIRFQQQLKLHIETVEQKLELNERDNEHLTHQNVKLLEEIVQKKAATENNPT